MWRSHFLLRTQARRPRRSALYVRDLYRIVREFRSHGLSRMRSAFTTDGGELEVLHGTPLRNESVNPQLSHDNSRISRSEKVVSGGAVVDSRRVSGWLTKRGAVERSCTTGGSSLALIGNASGADCGGGAGSRSEAFSIRRLGGSRWRLRRTRCAMGFERQPGSEQSLGRAMRPGGNAIRMVGVATEMSKSARGKLHERQWRSIGHTRASACRSTSSGR